MQYNPWHGFDPKRLLFKLCSNRCAINRQPSEPNGKTTSKVGPIIGNFYFECGLFQFPLKHPPTQCHFLENGGNVYACLLDASSAFDRVHYRKLFDVLIKRNMPAVFIRLLLDSYLIQRICAAWGACKSDFFQATSSSLHILVRTSLPRCICEIDAGPPPLCLPLSSYRTCLICLSPIFVVAFLCFFSRGYHSLNYCLL